MYSYIFLLQNMYFLKSTLIFAHLFLILSLTLLQGTHCSMYINTCRTWPKMFFSYCQWIKDFAFFAEAPAFSCSLIADVNLLAIPVLSQESKSVRNFHPASYPAHLSFLHLFHAFYIYIPQPQWCFWFYPIGKTAISCVWELADL